MPNINIHEVVRVRWDKSKESKTGPATLVVTTKRDEHRIALWMFNKPKDDREWEDSEDGAA